MSEYGETDGRITFDIGDRQLGEFVKADEEVGDDPKRQHLKFGRIASNESALINTVYGMEKRGVLIDRTYCMDAIRYESARLTASEAKWKDQTGMDFQDSPASGFGGALKGASTKRSKKGRESFNAEALELMAVTTPLLAVTVL